MKSCTADTEDSQSDESPSPESEQQLECDLFVTPALYSTSRSLKRKVFFLKIGYGVRRLLKEILGFLKFMEFIKIHKKLFSFFGIFSNISENVPIFISFV